MAAGFDLQPFELRRGRPRILEIEAFAFAVDLQAGDGVAVTRVPVDRDYA
jgi:hypothetical protein